MDLLGFFAFSWPLYYNQWRAFRWDHYLPFLNLVIRKITELKLILLPSSINLMMFTQKKTNLSPLWKLPGHPEPVPALPVRWTVEWTSVLYFPGGKVSLGWDASMHEFGVAGISVWRWCLGLLSLFFRLIHFVCKKLAHFGGLPVVSSNRDPLMWGRCQVVVVSTLRNRFFFFFPAPGKMGFGPI